MTTPTISYVTIGANRHDRTRTVEAHWSGVDRPCVGGWAVKDAKMAQRLKAAILAGVVYYDAQVHTDTAGKTYVHAPARVLGRTMNADLRKLGF